MVVIQASLNWVEFAVELVSRCRDAAIDGDLSPTRPDVHPESHAYTRWPDGIILDSEHAAIVSSRKQ